MLQTASSTPVAIGVGQAFRWLAWWRLAWKAVASEEVERVLLEACDHADLERRLRRLERGRAERFGVLPPGP